MKCNECHGKVSPWTLDTLEMSGSGADRCFVYIYIKKCLQCGKTIKSRQIKRATFVNPEDVLVRL